MSKYQLLPAEVRQTEQIQLPCLVDNYCKVFLGILSILAVGGISVYLSGENIIYMYYMCKLFGKRAFQNKFGLRDLLLTIFNSADRVYDTTHPSSWQTLYISDHHL